MFFPLDLSCSYYGIPILVLNVSPSNCNFPIFVPNILLLKFTPHILPCHFMLSSEPSSFFSSFCAIHCLRTEPDPGRDRDRAKLWRSNQHWRNNPEFFSQLRLEKWERILFREWKLEFDTNSLHFRDWSSKMWWSQGKIPKARVTALFYIYRQSPKF